MSVEPRGLLLSRLAVPLVLVAVVAVGWKWLGSDGESDDELVKRGRRDFRLRRLESALDLADRVIARSPGHRGALRLAGELAIEQGDYDRSVAYLCELPDAEQPERLTGMLGPGDRMDSLRSLSRLAGQLEKRIGAEPRHAMANDHLAFILTISGRRWEARRPLLRLLRRGRFTKRHLVLLGEFENVLADPVMLEACLKQDPNEHLANLGMGLIDVERRDFSGALGRFESVAEARRDLAEAHARVLVTVLERGSSDAAEDYAGRRKLLVDERLLDHPRLWLADARWARINGLDRQAARCLWEAIRREPDLRAANYQLAQVLLRLGRPNDARRFRERARQLGAFERTLGLIETRLNLESDWSDLGLLRKAAEQCERMGRLWEAFGWASEAQVHEPQVAWARELVGRVKQQLAADRDAPQTQDEHNPAGSIDLSDFPRLDFMDLKSREEIAGPAGTEAGEIRFDDRASAAGVDFTYFNSSDSSTPGALMFEYTGGGVAVLDYDRDGWPDLYFPQGCPWPVIEGGDPDYHDRLFRNQGDGTFADVTETTGLGDGRFSQGAAVGDFDQDGWPDLYVANIGRNRLYRNNGDGTFQDVTPGLEIPETGWTTSCLVADIDGDGRVDLYDVNYLRGRRLFSTICESSGVKMACHPHEFPAAEDRWWKGDGEGGFVDATRAGGFSAEDGKGLGIVVGGFSRPERVEVFVANDSVPNFLFARSAGKVSQDRSLFEQRAMVGGLAVDREGRSQACMGVAAGDADGDGRLDLFVTNYFDEPNAFYRQVGDLVFSDATRKAGLREPGWRMLGFGTQFLDADLDGELDLVVANGHVDDLQKLNQPYRMRPQFYRNAGGGRFVELPARGLGDYFARELLGRGLARADLDRDGREDFIVSHLEQPASLLYNRTQKRGGWLAVRLVATSTAREAIGARVTVADGEWRRVHFLTAGDGYMASNQRQLVIGLGSRRRVESLLVEWPSGETTKITDVAAGGELVIVEGRTRAMRLPRAAGD